MESYSRDSLDAEGQKQFDIGHKYGAAQAGVKQQLGDYVFKVNWEHWLSLPHWIPEVATCLLFGVDPNIFLNQPYRELMMTEIQQQAELKGCLTPSQWIQFGQEQGLPLSGRIIKTAIPSQTKTKKIPHETELQFNWTKYQRARLWAGIECVCLLLGQNPEIAEYVKSEGLDYEQNTKEVSLILERDTIAKIINPVERVNGVYYYDKVAILDWANRIGLAVPSDVRAYIEIERKQKPLNVKPTTNPYLEWYLVDKNLGLDANLDHYTIEELWRYDENGNPLITPNCYGELGIEKILIKAVRDGELKAIVHKRAHRWEQAQSSTGWIKVVEADYNDISNEGFLGGTYVRLTIRRDDFKAWLKKTNQCLPDGCLLNLWFKDDESQSKAIMANGATTKRRKNTNKRQDNLTKAIIAAIQSIGVKPSFDELWLFFQSDKDETGNIADYKDTHITWKDTKGNFHDTSKKSLANRLSKLSYQG